MRSLYLGILLAMAIILALSVLVFLGISRAIEQKYFTPVFDAMDEVEVQDAREMLETRGPDAVVAYMHRLNSVFGGSHYLLDANGKDIVTGEDRSALVPKAPLTKWRGRVNGKALVMHRSCRWPLLVHSRFRRTASKRALLSLLPAGSWRHRRPVLASGGSCCCAYSANHRHHRTIRTRKLISPREDGTSRRDWNPGAFVQQHGRATGEIGAQRAPVARRHFS